MATVPRVSNSTVSTAPLPGVRVGYEVNGDAFQATAGRQLQLAGRELSQAGDSFAENALREQEQANADLVFQAEASLSDAWLTYQNEASQRRGTQAWGLRNDTAAWFDKTANSLGKDLNPAVKRLFDQRVAQRRMSGLEWASSYERRERDASLEQNLAASLLAAQNEAAANPAAVDIGVKNIERNLRATGQIMGWDQTYLEQRILEEQGKLHVGVIENLIEADPRAAQAYFNEHKAQIPGTAQDKVGKVIDKTVRVLDAQEFADAAITSGRSETEVLRDIRAKFQGDDEELLVAHVRSRFNERDAAIARAEKANREAVFNAIAEAGGDMTKVPTRLLSSLDNYDQQRALDYAERLRGGNDVTTDWNAYTNFMMLPDAEKAKVDPSTLRASLSNTEYKQVVGIVEALRNPTPVAVSDTATPTEQINNAADAIGLTGDGFAPQRGEMTTKVLNKVEAFKIQNKRDPSYGEVSEMIRDTVDEITQRLDFFTPVQAGSPKPTLSLQQQLSTAHNLLGLSGDKNADQRGVFDQLVTNEVDLYRGANGGRDPDYRTVEKFIERATKETTVVKNWWPDSTITPLTVEVPPNERSRIVAAFESKRNRKPTELEVREAYIAAQVKKAGQ